MTVIDGSRPIYFIGDHEGRRVSLQPARQLGGILLWRVVVDGNASKAHQPSAAADLAAQWANVDPKLVKAVMAEHK